MKKIKIVFEKVKKFFTKLTRHKFIAHSIMGIAIFFVILTIIIPTNPVYAIQVEDNDYFPVSHVVMSETNVSNLGLGETYTETISSNSMDLKDMDINYWNKNTMAISIVLINTTLGIGIQNIPLNVNVDLLSLRTSEIEEEGVITGQNRTTGAIVTLDTGNAQLDITTEIVSDFYCGLIINYQLEIQEDNTISNQIVTFQFLNWIDNEFVIYSFPSYYLNINYQAIGFTNLYSLENLALKEMTHYTQCYFVGYEHSSNLLDTTTVAKPIQSKSVWDNNAKQILKYLASLEGLPNRGYDNTGLMEQSYNNGFNSGKELGYQQGYNVGLQEGENATTNWIATISKGIGNVLSLEIAPNLPLGLLVAIPLVMGMIGLIFMFWRKD